MVSKKDNNKVLPTDDSSWSAFFNEVTQLPKYKDGQEIVKCPGRKGRLVLDSV